MIHDVNATFARPIDSGFVDLLVEQPQEPTSRANLLTLQRVMEAVAVGVIGKAGAVMNILVSEQIRLTEFHPADKPALIEHLREKEIYDHTLRIPFPYTEKDADDWFDILARTTQQQGRPVNWAIRNGEESLIGAVGFDGFQVGKSHRAEIGYWLAKPFWGRGIMTAVVQRACQYGFEEFGLIKVTAHVFASNPASARVLQKCGFEQEGFLKKHYLKDGQYLDARLYSRLAPEA